MFCAPPLNFRRNKDRGSDPILGRNHDRTKGYPGSHPEIHAMVRSISRRDLLLAAPAGLTLASITPRAALARDPAAPSPLFPHFPHTDAETARRVVGLAHSKLDELRPLIEERPTLANAAVDWGFGDWETAIGAASHTGQRPIVEFLISHGARPDLFTFTMLGRLDAVKSILDAAPALATLRGPHGISLLSHAKAGGEQSRPVLDYLNSLGNADPTYRDEPITEDEKRALQGEYSFGPSETDRLIIGAGMGGLTIMRASGIPRRMFHQGHLEFHPAGAPGVRIHFVRLQDQDPTALRVTDAERVIDANRC
ncbi:MAG: hypothetical protein JNK58_13925 [Phycisphaerae bacterium]|nr:hypothetical protein [Phycisphaerae bacterium]